MRKKSANLGNVEGEARFIIESLLRAASTVPKADFPSFLIGASYAIGLVCEEPLCMELKSYFQEALDEKRKKRREEP